MKKILFLLLTIPAIVSAQVAKHNSSGVNTFTDTRYVNVTGDTMTGNLTVPNVVTTYNVSAGSANLTSLLTSSGKVDFKYNEASDAADGTHYYSFVTSATVGPTSAASDEISNLYARYRWYTGDNSNAIINGVLGECSSHGADESITCNGGQFMSYAVPGASIRSYKGLVASARSSYLGGSANTADSGTAFIGADVWMAPYFTAVSTPNITAANFAGIRIWNEHASIPVYNGIVLGSGGGGFTRDLTLQNSETIDNAVNGTVLVTAPATVLSGTATVTGSDFSVGGSTLVVSEGMLGLGAASMGLGVTGVDRLNIYGPFATPGANVKGSLQIYNPNAIGLGFGGYAASPYGMWIQSQSSAKGTATTYPLLLNPVGGNVGIGLTAPEQKLHVAGPVLIASSTLMLQGSGAGLKTSFQLAAMSTIAFVANYTTTQTAFTAAVTGSTLTLTTSGNSSILLTFAGSWADSTTGTNYLTYLFDGVQFAGEAGIVTEAIHTGNALYPVSFSTIIPNVSAGVHTVALMLRNSDAGTSAIYYSAGVSASSWCAVEIR